MDDAGQLYVPLEIGQTVAEVAEEENKKEIKKLKRSYASGAAVSATCDSTSVGPGKEKKNWRETVKYLHSRLDRARILRREGSVITCDLAALTQVKEK